MENNMSDIMSKISDMINNNEIPDNIKDLLGSMNNNSNNSDNNNSNNANSSQNNTFDFSGIDINTIMKMQQIIKSMNSEKESDRANLLRSLKPYLKHSRQEKVEQYIQLFNIGKVIEMFNNNSGGDKNDL